MNATKVKRSELSNLLSKSLRTKKEYNKAYDLITINPPDGERNCWVCYSVSGNEKKEIYDTELCRTCVTMALNTLNYKPN